MEMEMGPFTFPEQSQNPTCFVTSSTDIISSWLEIDEIYTPTFPYEQLQDVHFLDDFQQFSLPNLEPDPLFLIPEQEEYSLPDVSEFELYPTTDCQEALTETSATTGPVAYFVDLILGQESDGLLNEDLCAIPPDENYESFFHHVLELASTPTTTDSCDVNTQTCPKTSHGVAPDQEEEEEEEEEEEVEEEDQTDNYPKPSTLNCKNLFSERNRRKRLSKQLLALRALVPNITKMDKRSVLVDALAYLKSIQEETARIQKELKERSSSSSSKFNKEPSLPSNSTDTMLPKNYPMPKPKPQILEIDTEKIEDRRFVVKITCKGGAGVGGEVLRLIESLGFEITYTALDQVKSMHILATIFIRVRKQGRMTEEKLRDCITSTALRSGLILQNP